MSSEAKDGAEIVTYLNNRGEKIRRWNGSVPNNFRAVLVIVHGLGDHILAYECVNQQFAELGIHICGYDQIGHGLSDGTRVDVMDFDYYVQDLCQFVSLIKQEYEDKPIFVMGYSMGGLVLGQTLLSNPGLCKGAIFCAPAIYSNVGTFKSTLVRMVAAILPTITVETAGDGKLTRNLEALEKLESDTLRYKGGVKARWASNFLKTVASFKQNMSAIKLPMLILHGDDDQICNIEGSRNLFKTVSSSDKEFKVYEKGYHRLIVEPDGIAEQLPVDISEWIKKRC